MAPKDSQPSYTVNFKNFVQNLQNIVLPRPQIITTPITREADVVSLPKKRSRPPMPPMRTLPHLVRGPQYNQEQTHLQRPRFLRTWDSFELGKSTLDQSISLRSVKSGSVQDSLSRPSRRARGLTIIIEEVDEFGQIHQRRPWRHELRRLEWDHASLSIRVPSSSK